MAPTPRHLPFTEPDFRILFESAPGLFLVLRRDFVIVAVSNAYANATKTKREEILGRGIFEVFPDNPDDPAATGVANLRASLERVLSTRTFDAMAVQKYDIRLSEAEGGGFAVRFWSPVNYPVLGPDGEVVYIIHRVEDVTEFIQLRQRTDEHDRFATELRTKTQQMESEIYARAQELQRTNVRLRDTHDDLARREQELRSVYERLYRLDHLKTQFFANVSHELRTPLTLILGPVQKLLTESQSTELVQVLRGVERNAQLLLHHVNDLLDIAKLEAGKLAVNYAEVDLTQLVRRTASHFDSAAQHKAFKFAVETPPSLPAQLDPDKIQRVVMNLISNAFKFTPPGGRIRCTLAADNAAGAGQAVVTVADSGPGIPPQARSMIFERFVQLADSATRQAGGTGLGLAIAKDFVDLHGGTISVGEAPEGGAEFRIALPRQAPHRSALGPAAEDSGANSEATVAPEARVPEAVSLPQPAKSRRPNKALVLIVEDNPDMRGFIAESLADEYDTLLASNGREGLEHAIAARPDLILTDMMMPLMSGAQMVEQIRRRPALALTPIIMLTAKADEELRVKLLRSGVQDYLVKPFPMEELHARVGNLVALKRARGELEARNAGLMTLAARLEVEKQDLEAYDYRITHDLRGPLRAITAFSDILLKDHAASLSPEAQKHLQRISISGKRMALVIEHVLAFSRLGERPLGRTVVDLAHLWREAFEAAVEERRNRNIEFKVHPLPAVTGDPVLLRQVCENLLGNALKYSRGRNPAIVEVGVIEKSGEPPVYFVRDNGVGFDPTRTPHLFEIFQRAHTEREFEGHGVGLAFTKRILERHGGKLWVEAAKGVGATFFFTVPGEKPRA